MKKTTRTPSASARYRHRTSRRSLLIDLITTELTNGWLLHGLFKAGFMPTDDFEVNLDMHILHLMGFRKRTEALYDYYYRLRNSYYQLPAEQIRHNRRKTGEEIYKKMMAYKNKFAG